MLRAVGLMSGTSMDGIDVALVETDGESFCRPIAARTFPYDPAFRKRLADLVRARTPPPERVRPVEEELTRLHAAAVEALRAELPADRRRIDLVGFHGHTLRHRPHRRETVQIGDGPLLADLLGLPVVFDFRSEDVRRGGQGAPLVPVHHALILRDVPKPAAVLNLGGIANITLVPEAGPPVACDVAPCNALLDDWMRAKTGRPFDAEGALTRRGRPDHRRIAALLARPFFALPPPKSLDRLDFDPAWLDGLSVADGLATAAALVAEATARLLVHMPEYPRALYLTGGGRRNRGLVAALRERLSCPVEPVEMLGRDGDALEAEAFATLAVRVLRGLPVSFPTTTGVPEPVVGGRIARPLSRPRNHNPRVWGGRR